MALGLAPLTVRDQTATNLAQAWDFRRPKLGILLFDVPFGPFGVPCQPTTAAREQLEWQQLRALDKVLEYFTIFGDRSQVIGRRWPHLATCGMRHATKCKAQIGYPKPCLSLQ